MKKQLPLLLLLLITSLLTAQTTTTYSENDLRDLARLSPNTPGVRSVDLRYEGVKGTPMLNNDWQTGAFRLHDNEEFSQELQVQLDLVNQLLYFSLSNGFTGSLPTAKVAELRLYTGEDTFRLFRVYPEAEVEGTNDPKLKYYEVLFDGPFSLLQYHFKYFREADFKGAYSADRRYDEYVDQHVLWLREGDQPFEKIKLKKKAILDALPSYQQEAQKVMKAQKITLREEADLVRLLEALTNNGD